MDKKRTDEINRLQQKMEVKFARPLLLHQALIHKSYTHECGETAAEDNERLEFLGDAVLELIITTFIYREFKNYSEGVLARLRSGVVSKPVLSRMAKKLDLGHYLFLGKGEELTGGRRRSSILADSFEAVIGALYIDSGFKTCEEFVLNHFKDELYKLDKKKSLRDYKTLLQEYSQKKYQEKPQYRVVGEKGPDHRKEFQVEVTLNDKMLGTGKGRSKQDAQQKAAEKALIKLGKI